jgi:hypothetical protein
MMNGIHMSVEFFVMQKTKQQPVVNRVHTMRIAASMAC